MRLFSFLRALSLGVALTGAVLAAGGRELKLNADKLDYDEHHFKLRLLGHVKITSEDMTMTSPYAEYHTDTKVGQFEGGVKITGPGTSAVGQEMKVFYSEQRAVLKGSVRLVSEKSFGAEPGAPTTMACDDLEYLWVQGLGKARGRIKVHQGNRTAYGDRADYHRLEQYVLLEGNVRVERGQEDWFTCQRARMDLVAQTVVAEGGVVARTRLEEGKKEASPAPPSQARPQVVEPEFPLKPVEAQPPIPLPGVDPTP